MESAMPEFRFHYTGKNTVPSKHGLTAADEADAFRKKDAFISKHGGKYILSSMQVFRQSLWRKVPDPSLPPKGKTVVSGEPLTGESRKAEDAFFAHKQEHPEPTPYKELTPLQKRMQSGGP
jgi:hypothetical protein